MEFIFNKKNVLKLKLNFNISLSSFNTIISFITTTVCNYQLEKVQQHKASIESELKEIILKYTTIQYLLPQNSTRHEHRVIFDDKEKQQQLLNELNSYMIMRKLTIC